MEWSNAAGLSCSLFRVFVEAVAHLAFALLFLDRHVPFRRAAVTSVRRLGSCAGWHAPVRCLAQVSRATSRCQGPCTRDYHRVPNQRCPPATMAPGGWLNRSNGPASAPIRRLCFAALSLLLMWLVNSESTARRDCFHALHCIDWE
jgi:hypothetical protein